LNRFSDTGLSGLSGVAIAALIRSCEISVVEVMEATRQQVERIQLACNPFASFHWEQAMAQAHRGDQRLRTENGSNLPTLFGLPFSVKDLLNTRDFRTSYRTLIV